MKLLLIGIALALLVHFFPERYHHVYYYSADKKQCVTRVEYLPYDWVRNHSYFTYGHYDDIAIPDQFVRPDADEGKGGNWSGYLHFEQGQATLVFTRGSGYVNLEGPLAVIDSQKARKRRYAIDSLLAVIKNDKSGNTYYIEGTKP